MKIEGKNVLVLGGAGFIGSHLVERLIEEKAKHIIVVDSFVHGTQSYFYDRHLIKPENTAITVMYEDARDYLSKPHLIKFDFIFNLAVLSLPHSLEYPTNNFNNNVGIVQAIIDAMKNKELTGKLIHFSSSEVYGSAINTPMDESHPYFPSTPYAVSKVAGDMLIQSYCRLADINASIIRPFNNYGPRQNDKSYAGVIPSVINNLLKGQAPIITGDGNQTRDYVYVKDTVEAAIRIAEDEDKTRGKIFNVASGREYSIKELVNTLISIYSCLTGEPLLLPVYEQERVCDVKRHIGSGYLIEDTLGFRPTMEIGMGLIDTVSWYLKKVKS